MHVCIVSNGPSANLYDPAIPYDVRVGVNWTVEKFATDWWTFNDAATFNKTKPLGTPKLLTRRVTVDCLNYAWLSWPAEHLIAEQTIRIPWPKKGVAERLGRTAEWNTYSGLSALGLAWYLKATEITVFGADMSGDIDHKGQFGPHRKESRWAQERESWKCLANWIAEANHAIIHRITLTETQEIKAK